jgi:hypothetical protein
MPKPKRRLNAVDRKTGSERKQQFMTIVINGKQKRVSRPLTIEGLPVDEFIARHADPIWLHQNGLWKMLPCDDPT